MYRRFCLVILLTLGSTWAAAANVITDGSQSITLAELRYLLSGIPQSIKDSILSDPAARYEYFRQVIQSKNLAESALAADSQSAEYFEAFYASINALKTLERRRVAADVEVPDLGLLAAERYRVDKETYARVPEYREASHILLLCDDDSCDELGLRADAALLLDRLKAGESFEDMARAISDDVASARAGGRLSGGIYANSKNIDRTFLEATFALDSVGQLSPVVRSQFGFHIIRLELVEESYLKPFEEVKSAIEAEIRAEYVGLATEEALKAYLPSENMTINGPLVDELLDEIR